MVKTRRSLSYKGVAASDPPQLVKKRSSPVEDNFLNFEVGTFWLNTTTQYATPPVAPRISDLYVLLNKSTNQATWDDFQLEPFLSLTGDTGGTITPDEADNINILGTVDLISVTGNPGTNTLTLDLDDSVVNLFSTSSGSAISNNHELEFVDGTGISMSGVGNDITISTTTDIATTYDTDAGTATPVANVLNIDGDGGNISTSAIGDTLTINSNESEILREINTEAGLATQVAANFNILGTANIITAAVGSTIVIYGARFGSHAFTAGISSDQFNVTGDSGSYRIPFDRTYFDNGGNFNTANGRYIAPEDGTYMFMAANTYGNLSSGMDVAKLGMHSTDPFGVIYGVGGQIMDGYIIRSSRSHLTMGVSAVLQLTAGTYVQVSLQMEGGSGDTASCIAGTLEAPLTWFSGFMLY